MKIVSIIYLLTHTQNDSMYLIQFMVEKVIMRSFYQGEEKKVAHELFWEIQIILAGPSRSRAHGRS